MNDDGEAGLAEAKGSCVGAPFTPSREVGTVERDDGVVGSTFGVADVEGIVGFGKLSGDEPSNFFVNGFAFGKPGHVSSFGVDEFAGCPVGWVSKVDMNTVCVVRQEPFVRNIQINQVGVDQS